MVDRVSPSLVPVKFVVGFSGELVGLLECNEILISSVFPDLSRGVDSWIVLGRACEVPVCLNSSSAEVVGWIHSDVDDHVLIVFSHACDRSVGSSGCMTSKLVLVVVANIGYGSQLVFVHRQPDQSIRASKGENSRTGLGILEETVACVVAVTPRNIPECYFVDSAKDCIRLVSLVVLRAASQLGGILAALQVGYAVGDHVILEHSKRQVEAGG